MMNGTKLYAGLLAGSAIGVLSSLPFVNLANCCCLWIFGGGMLASYLYQQNQDEPIAVSDALAVGAIAAVFAAVVGLVVSIPINYVTAPILQRVVARALESSQDVPVELRDVLENVSMSGAGLVASFVLWLVVYLFVVPAGALIGGLMFQKKAIAPAPPPAQPVAVDFGTLPQVLPVPPASRLIDADDEGPQSAPAPTTAEDASWDEAPAVLVEDTTPATPSRTQLAPLVDERSPASADTASGESAADTPDDDDLPPSSTPPSQPPPLPQV